MFFEGTNGTERTKGTRRGIPKAVAAGAFPGYHNLMRKLLVFAGLLLAAAVLSAEADQVEMQNGDRYLGHVVSLNADALILQSEFLGKVTLPRSRIAIITLGTPAAAKVQPASGASNAQPQAATNAASSDTPIATLRNLTGDTNLIEQVRGQFLSGAGGPANSKFDDLLAGLASGKLDMDGLRAQAKSSADQLRALKRESGGAADASLDVYLDILDNFLKETAQPPNITTNAAANP